MQREIKFRAWGKHYGYEGSRMHYYPKWAIIHGGLVLYFAESNDSYVDESDNRTDLVVMQYAGLKDKNGKEIYEGDIVKYSWGDKWQYLEVRFGHYEDTDHYDNPTGLGFYFAVIGKSDIHTITWPESKDYEVIGNIYENPELLEESNG